ncbi:MAG: HD domain-containing protein [Halanaerobiales bacterium]
MTNLTKIFSALNFAAQRHREQKRKGDKNTPYINHPISVVTVLTQHREFDDNLLAAAALHDVIEDTACTQEEILLVSDIIAEKFGKKVLKIVTEVTDNKNLHYKERKRLQVINTPYLGIDAKKIKIADKICNIQDLMDDPPGWPNDRKIAYLEWAMKVIEGARGVNKSLEKYFDDTIKRAYINLTGMEY